MTIVYYGLTSFGSTSQGPMSLHIIKAAPRPATPNKAAKFDFSRGAAPLVRRAARGAALESAVMVDMNDAPHFELKASQSGDWLPRMGDWAKPKQYGVAASQVTYACMTAAPHAVQSWLADDEGSMNKNGIPEFVMDVGSTVGLLASRFEVAGVVEARDEAQ